MLLAQPQFYITLEDDAVPQSAFVTITYAALGPGEQQKAMWSQTVESTPFGVGWAVELNGTLTCSLPGSSSYTITLTLEGAYTPLVIQFEKNCSLPLFDIGSFEHANNVMQSNVAQDTFSYYTSGICFATKNTVIAFFFFFFFFPPCPGSPR